jgi:hypothetical protein
MRICICCKKLCYDFEYTNKKDKECKECKEYNEYIKVIKSKEVQNYNQNEYISFNDNKKKCCCYCIIL